MLGLIVIGACYYFILLKRRMNEFANEERRGEARLNIEDLMLSITTAATELIELINK